MFLSHQTHLCSFITSLRELSFSLVTHCNMTAAPGGQTLCFQLCCTSCSAVLPTVCYTVLYSVLFSPSVLCSGCEHGRWNCSLQHCPVDGGLSPWSTWTSCSLSCGGLGLKTRTRGCTHPAPAHEGRDCQGPQQETTYCQAPDCPGTDNGLLPLFHCMIPTCLSSTQVSLIFLSGGFLSTANSAGSL